MKTAADLGLEPPSSAPKAKTAADLGLVSGPEPSTTASGLAASFARGAAPYAAGAALGAAIGAPFGGVGSFAGAGAGASAMVLTQLTEQLYNWLGAPFGHALTPQEASDKAFDALDIRRPQTWQEQSAESVGGFLGGMAGVPAAPSTPLARPLSPSQSLLGDFETQGVSPNVPTVGQGKVSGLLSNAGARTVVVSPVIKQGVAQQLGETAAAAERAAGRFGEAAPSTFEAGNAVGNALRRFAADKSQATLDYGNFSKEMSGAPPTPMTNTLRTVRELMGRFPNAPALTGLFTKSPIAKLGVELEPRTEQIPAETSPMLDEFGRPMVTKPAETIRRGGSLSMAEIQELRSQVGYQLEHPSFGSDAIPRAQLKQLYAAITQDMMAGARARGPQAVQALTRANTNYGIRMQLIDRLDPLVSGESKERIFSRLNSAAQQTGSGGDSGLLMAAKKVMTPQEWGDFGATIVMRMGEPAAGAKDVLAETNFSPSSFVTNYARLSPRSKELLFGPDAPNSPRANLESLVRVAQSMKNVGKLANVSHSGEVGVNAALVFGAAEAAWHAITTGQVGQLAGWGTAAGGGYGFAKLMMSPKFARWMYGLPKTRVVTSGMVSLAAANLMKTVITPPSSPQPPATAPAGGGGVVPELMGHMQ